MRRNDHTGRLFEFAREIGGDVIHSPYTEDFEKLCSALDRASSLEEKHEVYERLLQSVYPAMASRATAPAIQESSPTQGKAATPVTRSASTSTSDAQAWLFEDAVPTSQSQYATAAPADTAKAIRDLEAKRQRLLADVANSEFGRIEQRVAYLLQRYPETRDSYVALCIRYWRRFQSDVLEQWNPLELEVLFGLDKIESIGRSKRFVQNDLKLFRGLEDTAQYKILFQEQLNRYLAAHRGAIPEVRFYLDETGTEGDKAYTGVAGVCVINWKQYEKYCSALSEWRRRQAWPEPIHFSDTGVGRLDRAISFLGQLQQRRAGLMFLGYSMKSRRTTADEMYSLFVHLVVDTLHRLVDIGCLDEPRKLRVHKEADAGFDSMWLSKMNKQLAELIDMEFQGRLDVQPVEPIGKGQHVLLECADLIAGGMQRRALYKGRNPKDRLAEAVFTVTGFEDPEDDSVVFRAFPAAK